MTEPTKKPRRRARKADGQYKADTTASEAWEATDMEQAVGEKEVGPTVTPKVDGISNNTAGEYSKKDNIVPSFKGVTTKYH